MEHRRMERLTLVAAMAIAAVAVGLAIWSDGGTPSSTTAASRSPAWVSENRSAGAGPELEVGTERALGVFDLGKGRKIRLSTGETIDGMACLIEEADDGEGSSCLDNGFFAVRKVEFLVSSEGGPEVFTSLRVAGVAAPSIRAVSLVKTDGTAVRLRLNSEQAFVYESLSSDLEARIYPTALRLHAPNGKLVETVTFPPAG